MIKIYEKTPKHCPGLTTLFIYFQYRPEYVNIMHSMSGSCFDKKDKVWECSIGYLSQLIELFSQYDDIELNFLSDTSQSSQVDYDISDLSNCTLLKHQIEAVNYGLQPEHKQWLLLDTMGLGKTLTAITLAYNLKLKGLVNKCLIVCGVNAVKINWKKEIEKFSDLSATILGSRINSKGKLVIDGIPERIKQLKSDLIDDFFVITNIETLRDDSIIKELNNKKSKNRFDMIIVDEIHRCANNSSIQSTNLLKLDIEYKLGLTGTPMLNSPEDCFVPLKWVDKEYGNFTNFKNTYITYGGQFNNIPLGYKNLDILKYQLNSCSLRRTKDLLDLPPKTIINKYIDLEPSHRKFYDDIKSGIVKDVDKVHMSTSSLLAMVSRLRQATVCPSILTSDNIEPTKILYAVDLAKQIMDNGDKVVIFSTFKPSVSEISKRLESYNPVCCTGDDKDEIIDYNKDKFQNDDNVKCFIATWQKCGTGITLTAATYMIFLDTAWTNAEYTQNQDRIYRIGTMKPVTIYNIVCNDTIDERVLQLVEQKGMVSDYLIDDKVPQNVFDSLKQYIIDLR